MWLLSALACLTEYPDAVPVLFADRTRGLQELTKVRTRSHSAANYAAHSLALSQIRLFIKSTGKWRVLALDDSLPVGLRDKKPLHSTLAKRRDVPTEAWLPLLEKAFATLFGGYPSLNGGYPFAALEALTGDPVHVFAFDDSKQRWGQLEHDTDLLRCAAGSGLQPPRVSSSHDHDAMWARVVDAQARGHYLCVGTEGVIQSGAEDRQVYAIIELHEVGDGAAAVRLLCVRNPWGSFRWKGDWSECSELWESRQDVLNAVNPIFDDAEFYISFEDLRHVFYQLCIVQRGAARTTSIRFLAQAAFTEPTELARQAGAAVTQRRAATKQLHGSQSCLPRSRHLVSSLGAAAGAQLYRVGALANRCASAARKSPFAATSSPAEAASSLDGEGAAAPVVGAPAGGLVIGRPVRAAVAAIRSYLRPEQAEAGAQPGTSRGTAVGYAVGWPSSVVGGGRAGPYTVLRAYWRGEAASQTAPAAAPPAAVAVDEPPRELQGEARASE